MARKGGDDFLATLGLKLDADGFVSGASRAIGSMVGMGDSAERTRKKIENLATAGGFALGSLAAGGAKDLGSLIRSVAGLGFALGPLTGTITLAAASIGAAFLDSRKQAREELQKMIDDLHAFEGKFSSAARKIRIGTLTDDRDSLLEKIAATPRFTVIRGSVISNADEISRMSAAATELTKRIGALANAEKDEERQKAFKTTAENLEQTKRHAKELADELKRVREESEKIREKVFYATHPELRDRGGTAREAAEAIAKIDTALHGVADKQAAQEAHDAAEQQKRDLDEILFKLHQQLDLMHEQEQQAKRNRDILLGASAGIFSGVASHVGAGAVGGVVSGAISGIAGGPLAVAAGGAQAFVSALFDLSDAEKQAREQARQFRLQLESFTDSVKEQLGLMPTLNLRIAEETRRYREYIEQLQKSAEASDEWGRKQSQVNAEVEDLNRLLALTIEQLKAEEAERRLAITQDLEVRALYAAGLTEQAEAYELVYKQQREYNQAVKDGYDAQQLAILAEVQRVEAINASIAKVQTKIDDFARAISGLQEFRNSLLLSSASLLSPTDQLTEAKRQYDEIVAKARGGDLDASGRLPGAAQTLLGFAQTVFGSGSAFQSIFQSVLSDTGDLINRFTDQKTIQEQILAELVKTREEELAKIHALIETQLTETRPPNNSPFIPPVQPDYTPVLQAQLDATMTGLTQVTNELVLVRSALADLQAAQTRSADGAAVNGVS